VAHAADPGRGPTDSLRRAKKGARRSMQLKVDRGIYLVNNATKTYRYLRPNPSWNHVHPRKNERNKRHLDGYTRIFPDGHTKVFVYQSSSTTRAA
jgi:hypothetical protein